MARKPRLISAPPATGGNIENGWKQLSGSMGALSTGQAPIGPIPGVQVADTAFEAPEDLNYERMIAEREAELGLPPNPSRVSGAAHRDAYLPGPVTYQPAPVPAPVPIADLTSLPDRFDLTVERKGEVWKITSPGVHVGLWKAGTDLPEVVHRALASLAEMVSIDGIVAKGRRK